MITKEPSSGHTRSFESCIGCNIGGFFGNAVLIGIQNPDATRVAGYNKWKELGRQVRKGERGISILAPIIRTKKDENGDKEKDHKYVAGFTSATIFDVSQTDGDPLPENCPAFDRCGPPGAVQGPLRGR